ncbi:MAG: hypothetical protein PHZ12_08955 [Paludibacter sp.]|nr:hypothetical protein [Paludibacter sp.]MDD4429124.1 hypothetical protein [Paludibacter sp.]
MKAIELTKKLENAPVSERVKMLLEAYNDFNVATNKVSDIAESVWTYSSLDDNLSPFLLAVDEAKFKLSELIGLYIYDSFSSIKAVV